MSTSTPATNSLLELLLELPEDERLEELASLPEEDALALLYDWRLWARPEQLPPPVVWQVWLILTGRGWGKTRTGAQTVCAVAESGEARRIALVAPTEDDVRAVMITGPSGILNCAPPWNRPVYHVSTRESTRPRLVWPNGAVAIGYSAEKPERLRGPEHDFAWCDELCAWKYLTETWDMLSFGMRMGECPRWIITTTPKPIPLLKDILADPGTTVTRGSLYDNRDNLAPSFVRKTVKKYEGTRLGRQEINGEVLDDVPGALWTRAMIDNARWKVPDPKKSPDKQIPPMRRIVVGVDPAVTSSDGSDDTGIVVAGLGVDGLGYIISDQTCHETPDGWAQVVVANYKHHAADRVVAEINNGGELVEAMLRTVDRTVSYKAVHASRGKRVRAEPIAALYEQGRIRHLGSFPDLEDQMCNFVPDQLGKSPDRMDALVWALTELMLGRSDGEPPRIARFQTQRRSTM